MLHVVSLLSLAQAHTVLSTVSDYQAKAERHRVCRVQHMLNSLIVKG